jgi:hypothetical protein
MTLRLLSARLMLLLLLHRICVHGGNAGIALFGHIVRLLVYAHCGKMHLTRDPVVLLRNGAWHAVAVTVLILGVVTIMWLSEASKR